MLLKVLGVLEAKPACVGSMSKGVIYVGTGKKYVEEILKSAASVKKQMPGLPITVFSDKKINSPLFEKSVLIKDAKCGFIDRISCLSKSPYDKTLFLDSETFVCGDLSELFQLLEKYDLALAHSPCRIDIAIDGLPASFPEMNGGVILFRKSPKVRRFFSRWQKLYQRHVRELANAGQSWFNDQPTFRKALYNSDLKVATLSPEYNCRCLYPVFVSGEVKILHSRHWSQPDLEKVAEEINKSKEMRVFIPGRGVVTVNDRHPELKVLLQALRYYAGWPKRKLFQKPK